MILGIDGNEANVEKRVGIGGYAYELIKNFDNSGSSNIEFVIYLKNNPLPHMPEEKKSFRYRIIGPKRMWTQFALPLDLFLNGKKPDVFFTPSHYAPRFSTMPTAISIMDLSYIKFPDLFKRDDLYQLVNWTRYSARKARKIFTISNSSRNDIIKAYNKKPEDVIVTYPGIKMDSTKADKKIIDGDYILFVGTLQPRKNIEKLVEAFSKINKKDIKLVIVGKRGWLYEPILASPEKFKVKDRVIFMDFAKDEDLPSLYRNALCFVLPSLYEGFGLPILEAMKYGCPVLSSNVSSLPEAGGDAALYFDPQDTDEMAKKIEEVISDSKLRDEMTEKGYNQIKKFSWEKTAKQTLKVLEELGNGK